MKKWYSIFYLFFFLMGCSNAKRADEEYFSSQEMDSEFEVDTSRKFQDLIFQKVSANQLVQMLTLDKAYLVDCRSIEEFNQKRIGNAIHLDFDNPHVLEEKFRSLDRSRTFYVYGKNDQQIQEVGNWLIQEGVKQVYFLDGGIQAWEEAQLPVNH
jgi:rhodanese-related sulfurtransferase